jgi:hypothetical protein
MNTVELILTIRLKQALEVTQDPGTSGRRSLSYNIQRSLMLPTLAGCFRAFLENIVPKLSIGRSSADFVIAVRV